jgi:hypothetical protein
LALTLSQLSAQTMPLHQSAVTALLAKAAATTAHGNANPNPSSSSSSNTPPVPALDTAAMDILLEAGDRFWRTLTREACALAHHRGSTTLQVRDAIVALGMTMGQDVVLPGFGDEGGVSMEQAPHAGVVSAPPGSSGVVGGPRDVPVVSARGTRRSAPA